MPELPDLEYVVPRLRERLAGRRITGARVKEPIVLRIAVPGDLESLTVGSDVRAVDRRAQFVRFDLGDLELIVNCMLAGRYKLCPAKEKTEATLCFALAFEGGEELRYLDDKKMGKVYLVRRGDRASVPGYANLGVE